MGDLARMASDVYGRSGDISQATGILQESGRAMLITDGGDGRIAWANRAAGELFGPRLVGANISRLVPDELREPHDRLRQAFMRAPRPRPMSEHLDVAAIVDGGRRSIARIALTPIPGTTMVIAEIDHLGEGPPEPQPAFP